AIRRSIQLDPKLPNAHARLATVLLRRRGAAAAGPKQEHGGNEEARQELREARRLNPNLPFLSAFEGELELADRNFAEAERLFEQALREDPRRTDIAQGIGWAVVMNQTRAGSRSARLGELAEQFPD